MKTRNRILIAAIGIGLAAPFLRKAIKPLGSYIIGGGIMAYELGCELAELTGDVLARTVRFLNRASSENSPKENTQQSSR